MRPDAWLPVSSGSQWATKSLSQPLPPLAQTGTPVNAEGAEHRAVTDTHHSVLRADLRIERSAVFDHSVLCIEMAGGCLGKYECLCFFIPALFYFPLCSPFTIYPCCANCMLGPYTPTHTYIGSTYAERPLSLCLLTNRLTPHVLSHCEE